MQFDGEMNFDRKPEDVWTKLSDVRFLVQCIPDTETVSEATEDHAECKVRPGFSFVRGSITLTIQRAKAEKPEKLAFSMIGKSIGSSNEVESRLTLNEHNGGTKVQWTAEVKKLGGLLKAVPKGLITGAAQKIINDVWDKVSAKIAESPDE